MCYITVAVGPNRTAFNDPYLHLPPVLSLRLMLHHHLQRDGWCRRLLVDLGTVCHLQPVPRVTKLLVYTHLRRVGGNLPNLAALPLMKLKTHHV